MSHFGSAFSNEGNVIVNEALGSHHYNDDFIIYDTDSGKWFRSLFDLEQSFWASKFYELSSDITPMEAAEGEQIFPTFQPVSMAFTSGQVDIVGMMKSVTPILAQRVDGVELVAYQTMPTWEMLDLL